MSNLKRLTLATLFALSAISLLAGCGETGPGDEGGEKPSCTAKSDCKSDEQCVNLNGEGKGFCMKDCKTDKSVCDTQKQQCATFGAAGAGSVQACLNKCGTGDSCPTGQICDNNSKLCIVKGCQTATDDCGQGLKCNVSTKSCVKDGGTTQGPNNDTGCENQASCGSGPIWLCDKSGGKQKGVCKTRPMKSVVIMDKGADCSNKQDTGADIVGIAFMNSDGTVQSWATTPTPKVEIGKQAGPGYNNPGSPDGKPADYKPNNHCATDKLNGGKSKFTSIGCEGYLAMAVPSALEKSKVAVFEYDGKVCGSTPASEPDDKYAVYGCITDVGAFGQVDYSKVSSYLATNCVELTDDASGYSVSQYPPTN